MKNMVVKRTNPSGMYDQNGNPVQVEEEFVETYTDQETEKKS